MLEVLYSEYDAAHRGDFVFDIPEGLDSWLLLMTQTPAIFYVNDKPVECPPNTIMLYRPRQKISYMANDHRFANDWIMFNSDELFVTETTLPLGVPLETDVPSNLHSLFRLIAIEHQGGGDYEDAINRKLLQVIFYKLLESNEPVNQSVIINDIHDLRREILAQPEIGWSLGMMAEKLNISTGYLESSYKAEFGISCMEEVIRSRVDMAKRYLSGSSMSISEIVTACGYKSPEHFYRQFKKMTGTTPRNYRLGK